MPTDARIYDMTPQELALNVKDELVEAIADLELSRPLSVVDVVPPPRLDADTYLSVILATADGTAEQIALPSSLAVGYLADEEAAVDEWRLWIHEIAARYAS